MVAAERRIGQLLGKKYRLQELLGSGGMGIVYGARHESTGRALAIKVLRPELAVRADWVERVSREARLAVEASHPNVVQVLDSGTDDDGIPYLVLERLYGHSLDALLAAALPLTAAMHALVPVINALARLHQAGIVHRDVKPSNIFLSRDRAGRVTPKLLDFGIAKLVESGESTLTGLALGTPAYMAPEQLLGSRSLSPACDVWSIAVVCVRCLSAGLPFDLAAGAGVGALRNGLRPEDLPGVPEPVALVLSAALRWEARARLANALELRAQLLAALQEVDAGMQWPNESSVSFGLDESELARLLATEASKSGRTGTAPGFARPQHVVTRTLSQVWRYASARLPPRWLGPRSLAVLSAATLLCFVESGRSRGGNVPGAERALGTSQPVQGVELPRTTLPERALDVRDEASSAAGTLGLAASPAPPQLPEQRGAADLARSQRASSIAATRRAHARTPAAAAAPAPRDRNSAPQALGANRSPIIE